MRNKFYQMCDLRYVIILIILSFAMGFVLGALYQENKQIMREDVTIIYPEK